MAAGPTSKPMEIVIRMQRNPVSRTQVAYGASSPLRKMGDRCRRDEGRRIQSSLFLTQQVFTNARMGAVCSDQQPSRLLAAVFKRCCDGVAVGLDMRDTFSVLQELRS